jgi:hypothetical protein
MKTLFVLFTGLFLTAQSFSLIADNVTRDLDKFSTLEVMGNIKVTLIPSTENKAEINIIKGDIDDLKTTISNNTLEIKFKGKGLKWNSGANKKAEITLYFTNLNEIDISAGARVSGNEIIKASTFEVDASSGSFCSIPIEVEQLKVSISSGASVTMKGTANDQDVDLSSGASYKAKKLETEKTTIDVSSGASAVVWAKSEIEADANSGGSIKYKGAPEKTNIDAGKYSGGSIKAI